MTVAHKSSDVGAGPLRPMPARLTVVEHLYLQQVGGEGDHEPGGYTAILSSEEQLYDRNMDVADSLTVLPQGWGTPDAPPASCVAVKNRAKPGGPDVLLYATQNDSVRRDMHSQAKQCVCFAVIPPGESCRFRPCPDTTYAARASTKCRITVLVFPG